jgi:polysaccharide deacetylase family protein (PEP-CTERM system associated)
MSGRDCVTSDVIRRPGGRSEECLFSVDVEDWFHILDVPSTPRPDQWSSLPSRIERNFLKLLDLFAEREARVTCFFLGWVAEKFPHLVVEAARRGHEIGSHGYAHRLVYESTPEEFFEDAVRSREIIEDRVGERVLGYRSAGFSVTAATPWFFDKLIEAGYRYDSSLFPAPRGHGGLPGAPHGPHVVTGTAGRLAEFPITVARLCGWPLCLFGGGYLRLFPYWVIRRMARSVLAERRPVVFYIHPREVDPAQPRLAMSLHRRFKSYINLRTTEEKVRRILDDFSVTTFERFIAARPVLQC